jgi:hypothetical protein
VEFSQKGKIIKCDILVIDFDGLREINLFLNDKLGVGIWIVHFFGDIEYYVRYFSQIEDM